MAKETGIQMLRKTNVLRYTKERAHAATLRNHHKQWRKDRTPVERCDIPECVYFTQPLIWNEGVLPVILDHINGVNSDNRPETFDFFAPTATPNKRKRAGARIGGRSAKTSAAFGDFGEEPNCATIASRSNQLNLR